MANRLIKHISRWGSIEALFLLCCGATWKSFESTKYAPYMISAGFSVCVFLSLYKINQRKTRPAYRYGVPALAIPVFGILCLVVNAIKTVPPHWEPPELPPGCASVAVKFGSDTYRFPVPMLSISSEKNGTKVDGGYLRLADIQMTFGNQNFKHPLRPEVKNNRFYLSVTIPNETERKRISMDNALDHKLPPSWDRNYSINAFEIVREDNTPVLQVIYRRADVLEVYGVFVLDTNHVFVTFGPTNSMWLQNLTADNTNITADSTAEILTTTAFDADFVKRKPLFKYPSYRNMGVFAE